MILRNKICIFALITTLLSFAFIFRHLAVSKLSPIIRIDNSIHPPPLMPDNVGNDTVILVARPAAQTGHTHYDEKGKAREWTLEEWLLESNGVREEAERSWNTKPLGELCAKTEWRDDMVFECLGDAENIRQNILTCIRYAISSGASLYIPAYDSSVYPAGTSSVSDLSSKFSLTIFSERIYPSTLHPTLTSLCPELKIFPLNEGPTDEPKSHILGPTVRTPTLHPDDLPHWGEVMSVRNYVHQLADKNKGIRTLVPFGPVANYYPVCADGVDFVDTFGQLLDLGGGWHLERAEEILWKIYTDHHVPLTPGSLTPGSGNGEGRNGFLGVKFEMSSGRTENPSVDLGIAARSLPSYEVQRDFFIKRMMSSRHGSHGLKVVYISSPKPIFDRFKEDVEDVFGHGIMNFLRQEEEGLRNGSAGSEVGRGVVDQLVLLRAQYFLGIGDANSSWQIALKRSTRSKAGSCGYRKPWMPTVWGSATWDEFSDLMGDKHYDEEWKAWP